MTAVTPGTLACHSCWRSGFAGIGSDGALSLLPSAAIALYCNPFHRKPSLNRRRRLPFLLPPPAKMVLKWPRFKGTHGPWVSS